MIKEWLKNIRIWPSLSDYGLNCCIRINLPWLYDGVSQSTVRHQGRQQQPAIRAGIAARLISCKGYYRHCFGEPPSYRTRTVRFRFNIPASALAKLRCPADITDPEPLPRRHALYRCLHLDIDRGLFGRP